MGMPKADLPFGGETLLARVIGRVRRAGIEQIVVAASANQVIPGDLPGPFSVARDSREQQGPLEAIRSALAALPDSAEAAFITSCDAPFLEPKLIRRLIDLLGRNDLVAPVEGRHYHPLAAVYHRRVLSKVDALIAEDRMRPFFLIEETNSLRVDVQSLRDVDPELHSFTNLNHPGEYFAALQQAGLDVPPSVRAALLQQREPD
jgi:molybdopterin-guanine dinucleotide biosynthesis protein A